MMKARRGIYVCSRRMATYVVPQSAESKDLLPILKVYHVRRRLTLSVGQEPDLEYVGKF